MKLSSLRYLLREGFRSIWQNRFMAIASVAVLVSCLMITAGAYLVFMNVNHAFDFVYSQNKLVAFVKEDVTAAQLPALEKQLKGLAGVESVTFLSKDDSMKKFQNALPSAVYQSMLGEENPLLDSYVITLDPAKLDSVILQLDNNAQIDDVSYSGNLAHTLVQIRQMVFTVGGWIIAVLLVVSVFIISNTIKLTVHNRRLEIYIMKSVGATNSFIRLPFIIEGLVIGLVSGLLGFGIIWGVYGQLAANFSPGGFMSLISFGSVSATLLIGFLAAGGLTGVIGSAVSMGKYLRDEGGINDE